MPTNVPELMLNYLNFLNRSRASDNPDNPTVHLFAKRIAWICVEKTLKPDAARKTEILSLLSGDSQAEHIIDYMTNTLGLLVVNEPAETDLAFDLDPLAEYLAALYLIEWYKGHTGYWKAFFRRVDQISGAPASTRGFLFALLDCADVYSKEYELPDMLEASLHDRLEAPVGA